MHAHFNFLSLFLFLQNTLWPETRKLYGHGYELLCVAASHSGSVLASAAKASLPVHAVLRLWSVATWAELYQLPGHQLSVTQLAFSHDDEWLLSASRDRQWCLYRRADASPMQYSLHTVHIQAHERIIWSVSWAADDSIFATAARDKTVKVWQKSSAAPVTSSGEDAVGAVAASGYSWGLAGVVCSGEHSATAVAVLPSRVAGALVVAVIGPLSMTLDALSHFR